MVKDQKVLLDNVGFSHDHIDPSLLKLASLGNSGKCKGNVHRDLLRDLGDPCCPELYYRPIPCAIPKGTEAGNERIDEVSFPFTLPHLVLSCLWSKYKDRFNQFFRRCL